MFYFCYIRDLLIEREFNTPQITDKLYYTYKLSASECKTPRMSSILKISEKFYLAKIKHFTVPAITLSLFYTFKRSWYEHIYVFLFSGDFLVSDDNLVQLALTIGKNDIIRSQLILKTVLIHRYTLLIKRIIVTSSCFS